MKPAAHGQLHVLHLHLCLQLCDLGPGRLQLCLRITDIHSSNCAGLRGRQVRHIYHLIEENSQMLSTGDRNRDVCH